MADPAPEHRLTSWQFLVFLTRFVVFFLSPTTKTRRRQEGPGRTYEFAQSRRDQPEAARLERVETHSPGIEKRFEMENFPSVMNLVNRVADLAEEANHHPDIFISYNQVTFTLTTHDAGGITEKDFDLAQRIETIAP